MTKSIISYITNNGGSAVYVECHISNNLPTINIIGYATKSVDEAKDRLRAAFVNSALALPKKHITINLAPADTPKDSSSLDVAMAVAILCSDKQLTEARTQDAVFLGELGLDGTIKPIRGIIGLLIRARTDGYSRVYIPKGNTEQAGLVPGIQIIPVSDLKSLYYDLTLAETIATYKPKHLATGTDRLAEIRSMVRLEDITGQFLAKRALEIAAAGRHNLLLNGPPGVGKSMLAKALPSILPKLSTEEMLEVTHLHSLGTLPEDRVITSPPIRSPHHTASISALIGGGTRPIPGEISLAHHGILFLDEINEFSRNCLESLRQPLEDRSATVSRVKETVTYPANFILVATQNPCPCGYYSSDSGKCTCSPQSIDKYRRKLSGPIQDRIDLHATTESIDHSQLLTATDSGITSAQCAQRVMKARMMQYRRYDLHLHNAELSNDQLKKFIHLAHPAKLFLNGAATRLQISARAYMKTVKIARTIADLDGSEAILESHIAEALQYRALPIMQPDLLTPVN